MKRGQKNNETGFFSEFFMARKEPQWTKEYY
jgi:hypothetical protein